MLNFVKVILSSRRRRIRLHGPVAAIGLALMFAVACSTASAQWIEKQDLAGDYVDSEPFDVLYLNEQAQEAILKIKPLGSAMPDFPLAERGKLIFEYFAESEEKFEVPYSSIKEVKTFNQLLIDEAEQWLKNKEYAKAFRNLFHVYNRGGKEDPALVKSLKSCMFLDGKENFQNGEFELALSIFEDIYQRDPGFRVPDFPLPLVDIVLSCHNGMIQKRFDAADYLGVRQSLSSVVEKYGKTADKLKLQWNNAFLKRSDELIADAKRFANGGKGREAHLAAKQADQMSPNRPEVLELKEQLLIQFPLIVVGVSQSESDAQPNRIEHWGSRRVGRLTQRTLLENTGLTDEGGKFEFLNGVMYRADEVGLKYILEIKEDITRFAVPPADAFQISRRLLSMADPESPNFNPAWEKIVDRVAIEDENRVSFTLRTPFVRPEALLKSTYANPDENGVSDQNGLYVLKAEDDEFATFELNSRYERKPNRQHPAIVEQLFSSASTAVDQLIAGNIDVLDRVPIADIPRLKTNPEVAVRSYLLPTVHMLVPKIRGELKDSAKFRNGLSHAIDRQMLVNDVICGGQPVNGCEVISGPFPIGTEENDQISYGYDIRVKPLPFNSQLGMVLINLALRPNPPVHPDAIPSPKLVIAYPNSSSAANASAAIARMWTEVGVETTVRELNPGDSIPPDDQWDFLYLELSIEEPLVDAFKMIGPHGFASEVSAPIQQTLRNLSYAQSWRSACSDLRRLHRQTAVDLSIIPLWQVKEHYAYRNTVREIGRDLIHLYQNADRWKIDLTAEEENQEK